MEFTKKFISFPQLETKRLFLRALKEEDASAFYEYYQNEEVYRYLDWNGPSSVEHAKRCINAWNKGYEEGWIIRWAIVDKKTGKCIGTIFFGEFNEGVRAEVGYELSKAYWNRGIMSEALQVLIAFGIDAFGFVRIQALVNPENKASRRLLEKIGFEHEGLLKKYEYHYIKKTCHDMDMFSFIAKR